MTDLVALRAANSRRWRAMHVHTASVKAIDKVARRLVEPEAKKRYLAISKQTKVPWPFIAVTHERESSQNWSRSLAQGDPWNKRSTHVPIGRGPFDSFEDAAYDALVTLKKFDKVADWSIGNFLTLLESYNGYGYANKGKPSPYIWAQTDQYVKGKYVADGDYRDNVVDVQMGCAPLLARMMALDVSIVIPGATVDVHEEHPATSAGSPKLPAPPATTGQKTATGAVVITGGAAAATAAAGGFEWGTIVAIAVIALALAAIVWHFMKSR